MISRSEAEFELFEKIDIEDEQERQAEWEAMGNTTPCPPQLMREDELPSWLRDAPEVELGEDELALIAGKRRQKKVSYDDELTEQQFNKLVYEENDPAKSATPAPSTEAPAEQSNAKSKKRKRGAKEEVAEAAVEKQKSIPEVPMVIIKPPKAASKTATQTAAAAPAKVPKGKGKKQPSEPAEPKPKKAKPAPKEAKEAKAAESTKVSPEENPIWYINAIHIFNAVYEAKDASGRSVRDIFMKLPTPKVLPDYYALIKQPMDLSTVRRNLSKKRYTNFDQFSKHMRLIFTNARTYNIDGSQVFNDSYILEDAFNKKLAELMPEAVG
eukprot:c20705_g1_i8.p1 GENE.c20705_g1_i8~~c20705_g1_i8.p1  ORF type:complete len:371 (+),score=105.55 c20705_g1_i8:136-1113(+)